MLSRRPGLLALDLVVGLNALIGGTLLVLDPQGGLLGMQTGLLQHAPFRTFLVPGVVLAGVVGGTALCAAAAHWMRSVHASRMTAFAGLILAGWIVVEVILVRVFHPLQPTLLLVGGVQMALGLGRGVVRRS